MAKKSSSGVFKSFFDNYYGWENSRFRECVDNFLYHLASNMDRYSFQLNEYQWSEENWDKPEIGEMVRVLRILQPSLEVIYTKSRKIMLAWVGRFNVPAQYFKELKIVNPTFPPVVRLASSVVRIKSNIAKNLWTGRLRSIKRVNYMEEMN